MFVFKIKKMLIVTESKHVDDTATNDAPHDLISTSFKTKKWSSAYALR